MLLYYYTTILRYYYTTILLYYYTTILLHYCTTILLYYYTTTLLYYYYYYNCYDYTHYPLLTMLILYLLPTILAIGYSHTIENPFLFSHIPWNFMVVALLRLQRGCLG